MEAKEISFVKTVFELCSADPQVAGILAEAGFTDILKPGMLQTAGRFMTLKKGAVLKDIAIEHIKTTFEAHGYSIKEEA